MLAIAGGKGGTGKTTTALALARALARTPAESRRRQHRRDESLPARPLVVDADVDMPDLHAMVGVARTPTVLDEPRGTAVPELNGVRVAPAPPPARHGRRAFGERLSRLPRDWEGPVLVDAPCGAGPDAALPLQAAHASLLVTRPTPPAVRDTAKTAAMARTLDTPVVGAAVVSAPVVGASPPRSVADALGVDAVAAIPRVDGDPLDSNAIERACDELLEVLPDRERLFELSRPA